MNQVILNSRVGADGVLRVTLPLGQADADREVQVIVSPMTPTTPMTKDEWKTWVESMAGSWQGEFERPPQGEFEERDPF